MSSTSISNAEPFLVLQEGDNMTTEKIKDELKELKEAHAADEGDSFFPSFVFSIVGCSGHLIKD